MPVCAAVMTGRGTSAIATIGVLGASAAATLARIFQPAKPPLPALEPGLICLGQVVDRGVALDQIILGCEHPQVYMLHCHGNPLIIKRIMELLERYQVQLVTPEQMHCRIGRSQGLNTLALEGHLALLQARTLTGTRIIMQQADRGLAETLSAWQAHIGSVSIRTIQDQAQSILVRSDIARRIIYGCRAVLVGPPNTGKSTLLNCLTGSDSAIVADVEGTTRDWVEAPCRLDSLYLTLIDTAGLDPGLMAQSEVERMSQQRTLQVLDQADLVLVVLDVRDAGQPIQARIEDRLQGKCVITVLNKSDLRPAGQRSEHPRAPGPVLEVSAKQETGITQLRQCIRQTLGMADLDRNTPVCFTDRQSRLLADLQTCSTGEQILSLIDTLLNGRLEDVESARF